MFKQNFGADSVLFMTITSWDKNHAIVAGNIFAGIIATAVKTATTDYLPAATQVHNQAFKAMLLGGHHPRSGTDGEEKSVVVALKNKAFAD